MQKSLIQTDPKICMGKPVIAGTRITVELILEKLATGETFEQILEAHPRLTMEGIRAALAFASEAFRVDAVYPIGGRVTSSWEDWLDQLKDEAGKIAKDELKNLVNTAKADSDDFIKRQGEKLELYLTQLAAGQITKEQFEGYVYDIRALTERQALKMKAAAKVRAKNLVNGIRKPVINKVLASVYS